MTDDNTCNATAVIVGIRIIMEFPSTIFLSSQVICFANDIFSATMTKIIKEMLPPDVRVARDAQDLLIECCVGMYFQPFFFFFFALKFLRICYGSSITQNERTMTIA